MKVELNNTTLTVYDEGIKRFELTDLRLVYLFLPGKFSYYVVGSSQQINSINFDGLDDDKTSSIVAELAIYEVNGKALDAFQFYIGNYAGQSCLFTLKDCKNNGVQLFPSILAKYKKERAQKRDEWVKTYPNLTLKGSFGSSMALTVDGLKIGSKFLAWDKLGSYEIQKNHFGLSNFLIIPKGVSNGTFSFSKYKYSLSNIPTKKYPLYMAECEFWRYLKTFEGNTDLVSQLKKLGDLKAQGVLTEERFEEAKQKLLQQNA